MKHTPILSLPASYALTVVARLEANSEPGENGCILFAGSKDRRGYGKFRLTVPSWDSKRMTGAHRAAWLSQVGDIPEGPTIDHLCFVVGCINVEHMELVTRAENTRRENTRRRRQSGTGRPRINGEHSCGTHGRVDGYLATRRDGYSYWACRPCRREISKRYQERQKLKALGGSV